MIKSFKDHISIYFLKEAELDIKLNKVWSDLMKNAKRNYEFLQKFVEHENSIPKNLDKREEYLYKTLENLLTRSRVNIYYNIALKRKLNWLDNRKPIKQEETKNIKVIENNKILIEDRT